MKITRRQLKQIIKEELENILIETNGLTTEPARYNPRSGQIALPTERTNVSPPGTSEVTADDEALAAYDEYQAEQGNIAMRDRMEAERERRSARVRQDRDDFEARVAQVPIYGDPNFAALRTSEEQEEYNAQHRANFAAWQAAQADR